MSSDIQKEEPAPSVEEGPDIRAELGAILHELRRSNKLLNLYIRDRGGLSDLDAKILNKLTEGL